MKDATKQQIRQLVKQITDPLHETIRTATDNETADGADKAIQAAHEILRLVETA